MKRARRVRYTIKLVLSYVLYYLGLLRLWQLVVLRRRAVVLMYHRVLNVDERRETGSHPGIVVSRDTFEEQMAALKRWFTVISLAEFTRHIERGIPFSDSTCLITFDDGWRDNFSNGLPVLAAHGLPAVVFLPVNFIGTGKLFWRETLTHLLVRAVRESRRIPEKRARFAAILEPVGLARTLDISAEDPRPGVIGAIDAGLPAVSELLRTLASELGSETDNLETPDVFMGWDDVRAMARQNVTFGGHGSDHRPLSLIPGDEAARDIRASKETLDSALGEGVPTFSYPNGYWNPEIAGMVKANGYRLAFTTLPGFVTCHDDPFALRRINIHEDVTDCVPLFLARLVGIF